MEVSLFSRINGSKRFDKIEYMNGTFVDCADVLLKNCEPDNTTLNKFLDVFSYFKNIQYMKDSINKIFVK